MKRALLRFVVPHFVGFALLACASEVPQKKQPVADKPVVASYPGIIQVGRWNDPLIDEMSACSRFRAALVDNAARLACVDFEVQACPDLVHPLADIPCAMYSDPSVSECERRFGAAETCAGLEPGACVLTVVLDPTDAQGMPIECEERDASSSDRDSSDTDSTESSDSTFTSSPDATVDGSAIATSDDGLTMTDATSSEPADGGPVSFLDAGYGDEGFVEAGSTLFDAGPRSNDGGTPDASL